MFLVMKMTHLVVQHLILRFHARHESILGQVIATTAILLVGAFDLFLKSLGIRWKESM